MGFGAAGGNQPDVASAPGVDDNQYSSGGVGPRVTKHHPKGSDSSSTWRRFGNSVEEGGGVRLHVQAARSGGDGQLRIVRDHSYRFALLFHPQEGGCEVNRIQGTEHCRERGRGAIQYGAAERHKLQSPERGQQQPVEFRQFGIAEGAL